MTDTGRLGLKAGQATRVGGNAAAALCKSEEADRTQVVVFLPEVEPAGEASLTPDVLVC